MAMAYGTLMQQNADSAFDYMIFHFKGVDGQGVAVPRRYIESFVLRNGTRIASHNRGFSLAFAGDLELEARGLWFVLNWQRILEDGYTGILWVAGTEGGDSYIRLGGAGMEFREAMHDEAYLITGVALASKKSVEYFPAGEDAQATIREFGGTVGLLVQ